MADGEINVAVQAEGVDDAAGELGGDGGGGGGGDAAGGLGGGGGGGGGKKGLGSLGKILTKIAALLVFLGPILDVLGTVTKVLTAFVAPLAVMLLRLLSPVMKILIKALPAWLNFMEDVNNGIEKIQEGGGFAMLIATLITKGIFTAIGVGWLARWGERRHHRKNRRPYRRRDRHGRRYWGVTVRHRPRTSKTCYRMSATTGKTGKTQAVPMLADSPKPARSDWRPAARTGDHQHRYPRRLRRVDRRNQPG